MYVLRTMNSLRMSFCIVPASSACVAPWQHQVTSNVTVNHTQIQNVSWHCDTYSTACNFALTRANCTLFKAPSVWNPLMVTLLEFFFEKSMIQWLSDTGRTVHSLTARHREMYMILGMLIPNFPQIQTLDLKIRYKSAHRFCTGPLVQFVCLQVIAAAFEVWEWRHNCVTWGEGEWK